MNAKTEYPFTREQYEQLTEEQKIVLEAVAEYLTGTAIPTPLTDQAISETFNLLKPTHGSVPPEEVGEDLHHALRRKFGAVYQVGLELAQADLEERGFEPGKDFSFCLLRDPDCEDATHITILDYNKPTTCYLHEWHQAWHFHFETLPVLADEVLRVRDQLVEQVIQGAKKQEIYIVLQNGMVREVVGLPDHTKVTVLDYDVEDVAPDQLQISPLDGELCQINRF